MVLNNKHCSGINYELLYTKNIKLKCLVKSIGTHFSYVFSKYEMKNLRPWYFVFKVVFRYFFLIVSY